LRETFLEFRNISSKEGNRFRRRKQRLVEIGVLQISTPLRDTL